MTAGVGADQTARAAGAVQACQRTDGRGRDLAVEGEGREAGGRGRVAVHGSCSFIMLVDECVEAVEPRLPERALVVEPCADGLEGGGDDGAGADAAVLGGGDEACVLEDGEVAHHRGQAQARGPGEVGHAGGACREAGQDRAARRVGEGVEDGGEVGVLLSHVAKY